MYRDKKDMRLGTWVCCSLATKNNEKESSKYIILLIWFYRRRKTWEIKCSVTYHNCKCGCDDVMGAIWTLLHGAPYSQSRFTCCFISNSSNSITLPYYSLKSYHFTETVQESLLPTICFVALLLNYSHKLLSWPLISIPLCEILQPISSLLCFHPLFRVPALSFSSWVNFTLC